MHPLVHGALLAVRGHAQHDEHVRQHKIQYIDMVIVNLYPFESTASQYAEDYLRCVENIDIGGPAMIRSAAKNHTYVTVITDTQQYAQIQKELVDNNGEISLATRKILAAAAFTKTAKYDTAISNYLNDYLAKH